MKNRVYVLHGYWNTQDMDGNVILGISEKSDSLLDKLKQIIREKASNYVDNFVEPVTEVNKNLIDGNWYEITDTDGRYAKFCLNEIEYLSDEKSPFLPGVVQNSNKCHKRTVSVNPIPHFYNQTGKTPYVKYNCPVCDAVGNKHIGLSKGVENCPLCGVRLNWKQKPEVGDTVMTEDGEVATVINSIILSDFQVIYTLKPVIGQYSAEQLTILNESED